MHLASTSSHICIHPSPQFLDHLQSTLAPHRADPALSITCTKCQCVYSEQSHLLLEIRGLKPIHMPKNNFLINAPEQLTKYNFLKAEVGVYKALGGSAGTGSHPGWAGSPWLYPHPQGFAVGICLCCSYASLWLCFLLTFSCSPRILAISHKKLVFPLLLHSAPSQLTD